ncbi:MAG TPA: SUMF1/EgtB/PvdO family nonheme iron enzyme [Anaerolineae bacterium]|nr:SUMF1/EgtB/PvdO family nonheme iron enzyme [Anaerolineae bacterium]
MKANPYIGPRPYQRGESANFFGREREGQELAWLILAEQAVLFYAQSGAGKTSLLNARVIPTLEQKGVRVLPVARVGSGLPASIAPAKVDNVFVFSALLALAAETAIPLEALLEHTLLSYLQTCDRRPPTADGQPPVPNPQSLLPTPRSPLPTPHSPTLLILDQFEEIATTHRAQWEQAEGFFRQVREALDALPGLAVLFVLREDYVAELDPYIPLLPSALQARFRMTLPTRAQALEIVKGPAEKAGCAFAEDAAEKLVANLSHIKTASPPPGGIEGGGGIGQYVEPVQLQVVCQQLWDSLPEAVAADGVITWDEIKHYNVDDALTAFYESALTQTCQSAGVAERRLRAWFSEALITPEERRGLALQSATETAGLPNAVVTLLEAHHLIRSEMRAGSRWYELSHDRLVPPIVKSNREWETAQDHTHPWRPLARQWQATRSETLLYRGRELAAAQAWLDAAAPGDVEPYEREFIQAGQQARRARARMRAWRTVTVAALTILVAVLSVQPLRRQWLRWQARRLGGKPIVLEQVTASLGNDALEDKALKADDYFVQTFAMEAHEVTNQRYLLCVAAGVCSPPNTSPLQYTPPERSQHPATNVTVFQAQRFCDWIGRRLPTELEWERAARSMDGRLWPWGDTPPEDITQAYFSYGESRLESVQVVGSASQDRTPEGIYDLAGNAWEWTCTAYSEEGYNANGCVDWDNDDPERLIVKGGDASISPDGIQNTLAYHAPTRPSYSESFGGFRCVEEP